MDEEDDNRYISDEEANPRQYNSGDSLTSGNKQSFGCPSCGSRNTEQGVYYELCKTCGWSQGY